MSMKAIGKKVVRSWPLFLLLSAALAHAGQAQPAEGFQWGAYQGRGEIEIGYRWVTVAGNRDMYRSMINLGEGPKLLRSDISLRAGYGAGVLFDRLDFSMYGWGGDPHNSMRLNLGRSDAYELRATYRHLNYFNFIPSYANPLLAAGILFGQHSLDVSYRNADVELRLFPNRRIRPFVGYARSSGSGPGFSTVGVTANEFLLRRNWRYSSDEYRGGIELDMPRWNLTLEQGYRRLRNDSGAAAAGPAAGNNALPFIGQKIVLDSLARSYRERTGVPVSRIVAGIRPFDRLRLTGRYVYSMADADAAMTELSSGNFVSLEERIIYAAAGDAFTGRATKPMHRGNLVAEFSPLRRLTILNDFDTRRFHVSGDAVLATTFLGVRSLAGPGGGTEAERKVTGRPSARLDYRQVRNQTEADYDLGSGIVVRAGYRYTLIEADLIDGDEGGRGSRSGRSAKDTALVGMYYRPGRWLHLSFAHESNRTDRPLTRTDLHDYGQSDLDLRLGPWKNLSLQGRVSILSNRNPAPDTLLDSQYRSYALGLDYAWGERLHLNLDYGRTRMSSDTGIRIPQTLAPDFSFYREQTDGIGGSFGIDLYRGMRVDFGYRGILSTGALPLNYHQPYAEILIPARKHFAWKASWQYYGYNEKGAGFQDYRGHLVTVSVLYR
jgi:hypothetical protein